MIRLLDGAVELMRTKHQKGTELYWIIHYTYMSPQPYHNAYEIIDHLRPYIRDISYATYFRRRQEAIEVLSSILWGYTSKDVVEILDHFFPNSDDDTKLI